MKSPSKVRPVMSAASRGKGSTALEAFVVSEEEEELGRIAQRTLTVDQRNRLAMLCEAAKNPTLPKAVLAASVGVSPRTINRWQAVYNAGGIEALLALRSRSTMDGEAAPMHQERKSSAAPASPDENHSLLARLFFFLSHLPVTTDTGTWIRMLKEELRHLLPAIDHIVLNINTEIDVIHPGSNKPAYSYRRNFRAEGSTEHAMTELPVSSKARGEVRLPVYKDLIDEWHGMKASRDYHEPHGIDFFLEDGYLGSLLVISSRSRPDLDAATLNTLLQLQPFLRFLICDHLLRRQGEGRPDLMWRDVLDKAVDRAMLTERQNQVLLLLLKGHTVAEIAGIMHLSAKTIEAHQQALYRRLDVHHFHELIARLHEA